MNKKIGYLLHRFPAVTDTFIKREIRSLQKAEMSVQIVSVWMPRPHETTSEAMAEWGPYTHFILARSKLSLFLDILMAIAIAPRRFLSAGWLALRTSRPGIRGHLYQLFYFLEAVLAANIFRREGIEHIHNHIGDHGGTVAMLAAHLNQIPFSITFHGWPVFFDAKNSRIKEKVQAASFTRSISYFCRSQLMMFSDRDETESFEVVHCGIELSKYTYRPPRSDVRRLFCAARLSPEKGMVFLIQAVRLLLDRDHHVHLRLAGDGPSRGRLEQVVRELGLCDKVSFLGFLSEDDIIAELQQADLFVLPSFVEGLPVSAIEAMAIGVPVVATNIAGTGELIDHNQTGVLVRPSDAEALMEAVVRMTEDHAFRLRACELGRKKVLEEFDVEKETSKLQKLFQKHS